MYGIREWIGERISKLPRSLMKLVKLHIISKSEMWKLSFYPFQNAELFNKMIWMDWMSYESLEDLEDIDL